MYILQIKKKKIDRIGIFSEFVTPHSIIIFIFYKVFEIS